MTDTVDIVRNFTKELGYMFPPEDEEFLVKLRNSIEDMNTRNFVTIMVCKHLVEMHNHFNSELMNSYQRGYDQGYDDAHDVDV